MIALTAAGVFFLLWIVNRSRTELLPLTATLLMVTYSTWEADYLSFGRWETEAGFISLLGWWGAMGAICHRGQQYLLGFIIRSMAVFYGLSLLMDAVANPAHVPLQLTCIVCWLASFGLYWSIVRKQWSWGLHIVAASLGAVTDVALYYVGGVVMGFDYTLPISEVPAVYGGNLILIVPLIVLYSLPMLMVRQQRVPESSLRESPVVQLFQRD